MLFARCLSSTLRKFIRTFLHMHQRQQQHPTQQQPFSSKRSSQNSSSPVFVNTTIKTKQPDIAASSTSTRSLTTSSNSTRSQNMKAVDIFEDALSCPVCLDEFRKVPKILPTCGHSFCLPCIEHWYEYSGGTATGTLRCPVCKCKTNLRLLECGTKLFQRRSSSCSRNSIPPGSSLKKLLADSPTVRSILKIRKHASKSVHFSIWNLDDQNVIASLQQLLTCQACHYRLDEPRMLPACRHSFCTTCLQKLYKSPHSSTIANHDSATIVCPVCQVLYRFNFRSCSPPSSPTVSNTKSICNEKQTTLIHRPPPPKEKLATYLPFDYVLGCLLDSIPEKL